MSVEWNTIHIFSYGETQVIGKDFNIKVATTGLTKAQAVLDDILSKKPEGNLSDMDYHAVTIFHNMFADYGCKNPVRVAPELKKESFRVSFAQLDITKLNELADEVKIVYDAAHPSEGGA